MLSFNTAQKDFIWLQLAFATACVLMLWLSDHAIGSILLILVVLFHIAAGLVAFIRQHHFWKRLWVFSLLFGALNIFPDWYLSAYAGWLVYPDEGVFKVGSISGYMPGLWSLAWFSLLYIGYWGQALGRHLKPDFNGAIVLLVASLLVYGLSEHGFKLIGSWHAAALIEHTIGNAAVYVIFAELNLMLLSYFLLPVLLRLNLWLQAFAALCLAQFYLGSLLFFYFLIESGLVFNRP